MERFLDDLFAKRGSVREAALSLIIDGLTANHRCQFVQKNFATLLYRCLSSCKKGSSKEIVLAYRALGLVSITIGCGDNAQELYNESLQLISQALKSRTESLLLSVIDCLAIATFVGANDFEQTEASMQIIWHFIQSNSVENVAVKKQSASVLSTAISAWSLLLTTIAGWNLNHNFWHGAISYFMGLLEADDQCVCMAAGEALALICEVGCLEKFSSNITIVKDSLNEKGNNISGQDLSLKELQEIVSNHAEKLLSRSSTQSEAAKALGGCNNFSMNVFKVVEDGCFRETTVKVGKHSLQLNSLSQLLQVNYVRRFLGRGFIIHMLENEFLHDVFNFTPRKQKPGDELYTSEREEVTIRLFVPASRQGDCEEVTVQAPGRRTQNPNRSNFRKAKTQVLNKQRALKGEALWPFDN